MNLLKKIDKIEKDFPEEEIDKITQQYSDKVKDELDKFFLVNDKEDIKELRKDIREMILAVDERVNYWESRRTQFLQLSIALIGASIVGIVAIFPSVLSRASLFEFPNYLDFPILISIIILFFGSIWLVMEWNKQNNPNYPFTKGYRVWRWHYRHAEKTPIETDVFKYDKDRFHDQVIRFANNLTEYKIKTLAASNMELLDQDLTQLYLLLINEKFKIKFVSKLRDLLLDTLRISMIIGIAALIISVIWGYLF